MTSRRNAPAAGSATPPLTRALLDSVVDGLYTVDGDGRMTSANPAAQRILGWSEEVLRGRDAHETFHFQHADGTAHPREACPLLGVLQTGRAVVVHSDAFTRADGRVVDVSYSSSPILEDGEVTGAVVIFRDVSPERDAQRRASRLTSEREQASAEWQRNLLPARLPDVPGVDMAVAFRPVGDGAVVGGDFYDLIASDRGHLLVLGDVRGKGPGAAAIAAMVRYVLRGAGEASSDLRHLLSLLNSELLAHPASRFCTLVLVHLLELEDGRLQVCVTCAGHPRPVLLAAGGTAREVGAAGPLLGVFDDVRVDPEVTMLEPGDALVLFSDGLLDAGRRLGRPGFDVLGALDGQEPGSSAELVTRLEQAAEVPDITERPDDVCVLVARRARPGSLSAASAPPELSAPADPAAVGEVEAAFRHGNERLVAGRPDTERTISVTCECGHVDCAELIDVPHALYERIRAEDREFVVLPGHDLPHAEHVVQRHDGLVVVRKHGPAGRAAEQATT